MRKRKTRVLAAGALGLATACFGQAVDGGFYVPGPNNALSAEEAESGYELLWNGKDWTGWKSYKTSQPGTNWAIAGLGGTENGAAPSQSPDSNLIEIVAAGESIWTADTTFQDFDWKAEYQTHATVPQSSALAYRYSESLSRIQNASAFLFRITNDQWTPEWKMAIWTSGSLYDIKPLQPSRLNPDNSPNWTRAAGNWNQVRIICYKGRIAHYGNGLGLLEDQMGTPDWIVRYQNSAYASWPVPATVHPGSLLLQFHGATYVKFRNLRVKRLTRNPWAPDSPYLDRDSLAAGDTCLIDTLTFATPLFPAGTSNRRIPSRAVPGLRTEEKEGYLSVFLPGTDGYELKMHGIDGARLPLRVFRSADRLRVPLVSIPASGRLTLWKDGRPLREFGPGRAGTAEPRTPPGHP